MTHYSHISSLYSEPWVAWMMLLLLVVALVSALPQAVGVSLRSMVSHSERTYASRARDWASEVTLRFFRVGVMAMALLLWVWSKHAGSLFVYVQVMGVVTCVCAVQQGLLYAVGHVFLSTKQLDAAMEQYSTIRTLTCVCLYPILLILTNLSVAILPRILCGIVFALYLLMLLIKSVQLFYRHALSILYILLYIVCLEILPLAAGVWFVQHVD